VQTVPILSLWQPWALLLAAGVKRIETRSWPLRRPLPALLAVHAAKKWDALLFDLARRAPFRGHLEALGVRFPGTRPTPVPPGLALGAVVGLVRVVEVAPSEKLHARLFADREQRRGPEIEFGDFTPGRWGFVCDAHLRLAEPVPMRGQQGLWQWGEPTTEAAAWIEAHR
jgi:activating signal cointegrator 1